jgi:hypothetical protein
MSEEAVTFKEACYSGLPFDIGIPELDVDLMCGFYWYTQGILFNWEPFFEEWTESVWNTSPPLKLASIGIPVLDYFEDYSGPHKPQPDCRCVTLLSGHWQGCPMAKLGYM